MELKLPLIIARHEHQQYEAWVPYLPGVSGRGVSLAELRDELSLAVMEAFSKTNAKELWKYQFPPHCWLHSIKLDFVAQDRQRRQRYELRGRLGVLVEKWPGEDYFVATPTRIPELRFALRHPDELPEALRTRLSEYCLEKHIETLDAWHAERRERLDLLEVDADPPSPFPPGPMRSKVFEERTATPEEREERRRMLRMRVRVLREIARNLSLAAQDDTLGRAFGRNAMVDLLVRELDGRRGAAIVLVGASGTGKTAVVHEVVRRLGALYAQRGERRDVWQVDGNRFIAGAMYVGMWEERARKLVEELISLDDILFVDDLASLGHAGVSAHRDGCVAQYLEPHLARGELTILAECTAERLENLRQRVPGFARLFRVVKVDSMTDRETVPVLLGALRARVARSDAADNARLGPSALFALLEGCLRFYPSDALPGRAVALLQNVIEQDRDATAMRLERREVLQALARVTGLPPFVLGLEPPHPRSQIVRELSNMVMGQPEAIEAITDVVLMVQHSLSDPTKPIANLLFVGPTGVGKTETAKALAKYLFGSASRMLRFDMSEFSDPNSLQRLVGAPWQPDGELTTALRAQPFRVVLFDEIEKADPLVFDALLQLLGEGRLTDAHGHTADARQCVLLMTSNLGVREAAARVGFSRTDEAEARKHYVSAVEGFFRPEFFNRIDRVVAFRSLGREALRRVVERALRELLSRRGIREANIVVEVEPELLELLVEQAFDPRYGARPLRRAIEQRLTVPLAHHLLRRRSTDLAMVRLYRRGQDMGLVVHGLPLADRLGLAAPEMPKKLSVLREQLASLEQRIEALQQSTAYEQLLSMRREALTRASAKQEPTEKQTRAIALIDALDELRSTLDEFGLGSLEEITFEETADSRSVHSSKTSSQEHWFGASSKRAYAERPVLAKPEVLLQQLAPILWKSEEEIEILELQVRAAIEPTEDEFTLLWESVTPNPNYLNFARLIDALPPGSFEQTMYEERESEGAWRWWPSTDVSRFPRRICMAIRGPGARRMVEPLLGYAVLLNTDSVDFERALLRIELIEGADGPAAVQRRDAKEQKLREQWSRGEVEPSLQEGVRVVARSITERTRTRDPLHKEHHRVEHVATGLALGAGRSILAAALRAERERVPTAEPPELDETTEE